MFSYKKTWIYLFILIFVRKLFLYCDYYPHMHALRCFPSFASCVFHSCSWVVFCLYVDKCSSIIPVPTPSPPFNSFYNTYPKKTQVDINNYNIFQIYILVSGFSSLLLLSLLQLCNHVKYVTFNTNLCNNCKITRLLSVVFIIYYVRVALL